MSLADAQSDLAAARTALLAGDYATALSYALAAQTLLAGTPDQQQGENRLAFEQAKNNVDALIANLRRQQSAALAASPRRRNVTYANPST